MFLRDFQERKRLDRTFFSYPVLGILTFLAFAALFGAANAWYKKHVLDNEIAALEEKIADTESIKKLYEIKLENLDTAEGRDREARERFNLKKPGEGVVLFVDDFPSLRRRSGVAGFFIGAKDFIINWFR